MRNADCVMVEATEDHPDARLIAAAPDLLAACKEVEAASQYWSEYDVPLGMLDRLKAAIARAEATTKEPTHERE
jgi:hypothetical protein